MVRLTCAGWLPHDGFSATRVEPLSKSEDHQGGFIVPLAGRPRFWRLVPSRRVNDLVAGCAGYMVTRLLNHHDLGGDYYARRRPETTITSAFQRLRQAGCHITTTPQGVLITQS